MPAPLVSDGLPDLIDEMAALLREAGADPLAESAPQFTHRVSIRLRR
jgi:hypothetical protein